MNNGLIKHVYMLVITSYKIRFRVIIDFDVIPIIMAFNYLYC